MKTPSSLAALLLLVVTGTAAHAAAPIGHVISLQGAAFADQASGRTVSLQLQSVIHANDRIRTEAGAKLQIMLADEAIIMVGQQSEMVMDSFVYSPSVAEENETSMSLLKGFFRVITAKVTDLNPERFKVKTNLASIGIRGCELGFIVRPGEEEIQIVRVPEGKSIRVENQEIEGDKAEVSQQGVMVVLEQGARLDKRALQAKDILRLRRATTPALVPVDSPEAGSGAFAQDGRPRSGGEVADGADAADSDVWVEHQFAYAGAWEAVDRADRILGDPTANQSGRLELPEAMPPPPTPDPPRPEKSISDEPEPEEGIEEASIKTEPEMPTVSEPLEDSSGNVPAAPNPQYPIQGTPYSVAGGGGSDWSWGAWARDDTLGETGGVPDVSTFYGTEISGNVLSAADFSSIASAGTPQVLTGVGDAVASVSSATQGALLTGSSNVQLVLGGGVTPSWQGDFNLGGGGGSLSFQANGVLDGSGALNTTASTYSLSAFGQGYDSGSLTKNQVTGNLVGSASGVTGSMGTFNFEHGGAGVQVQGVYGTDF